LFWFIATVGCGGSSSGFTRYKILSYELLALPLDGQARTWLTTYVVVICC
jgi:hypothetical protein